MCIEYSIYQACIVSRSSNHMIVFPANLAVQNSEKVEIGMYPLRWVVSGMSIAFAV